MRETLFLSHRFINLLTAIIVIVNIHPFILCVCLTRRYIHSGQERSVKTSKFVPFVPNSCRFVHSSRANPIVWLSVPELRQRTKIRSVNGPISRQINSLGLFLQRPTAVELAFSSKHRAPWSCTSRSHQTFLEGLGTSTVSRIGILQYQLQHCRRDKLVLLSV